MDLAATHLTIKLAILTLPRTPYAVLFVRNPLRRAIERALFCFASGVGYPVAAVSFLRLVIRAF